MAEGFCRSSLHSSSFGMNPETSAQKARFKPIDGRAVYLIARNVPLFAHERAPAGRSEV